MGVAAEVVEEFFGPGERGLGIDDPGFMAQLGQQAMKGFAVGERGHGSDSAGKDQALIVEQLPQTVQELGAEDLAESADGKEELGLGRQPAGTVACQRPAGDEAVDVEMRAELLIKEMVRVRRVASASAGAPPVPGRASACKKCSKLSAY